MVTLKVYVDKDCWSCSESRQIVEEIAPLFPQVSFELVDISTRDRPNNIFAVPTYILDGEVISLGNPYTIELRRKLQDALNRV